MVEREKKQAKYLSFSFSLSIEKKIEKKKEIIIMQTYRLFLRLLSHPYGSRSHWMTFFKQFLQQSFSGLQAIKSCIA